MELDVQVKIYQKICPPPVGFYSVDYTKNHFGTTVSDIWCGETAKVGFKMFLCDCWKSEAQSFVSQLDIEQKDLSVQLSPLMYSLVEAHSVLCMQRNMYECLFSSVQSNAFHCAFMLLLSSESICKDMCSKARKMNLSTFIHLIDQTLDYSEVWLIRCQCEGSECYFCH